MIGEPPSFNGAEKDTSTESGPRTSREAEAGGPGTVGNVCNVDNK